MDSLKVLRWVVGALFLLYPFVVYFGLQNLDPRLIAFLLLLFVALRLLSAKSAVGAIGYWAIGAVAAMGFTLLTGSEYGLLFYPVLINALFLLYFSIGLFSPPTIIEKIARLREPELSLEAIAYTRKVTLVWCVFFILNGVMAGITIFINEYWWALYNGFIAYVLMGVLFAGEFLVRHTVRKHG